MFDETIENLKEDIIASTCKLIQIPSVDARSEDASMPFGEHCAKALDYMLNLGKELGFRTKNIDGYCGYIEFGEGDELLGIIGHLDVVPEGENWTHPPFSATIQDGKIYGRGAIDDKGPVIASLYAMKAIMENCKVNKRVRLILGLNEEKDWECIKYYKANEEIPTLGFSPDADFPCIYAEKGLLSTYLSSPYHSNDSIKIKSIDCNNAINVVPKFCNITLSVDKEDLIVSCINKLEEIVNHYNFKIDISNDNNIITLNSYGIAAHAAHPDFGTNAISQLLIVIHELFLSFNIENEFITNFYQKINLQYDGKDLGIDRSDESGTLTLNVAQLSLDGSNIRLGMNLRIPIHTSIDEIKEEIIKQFKSTNITVSFSGEKNPLYLPKDHFLIQTLCRVFEEVTHTPASPIAIGGATYARAFPNCVSFGANMPGDKDMCHQVDEFISIDNLMLSTRIYTNAIYELTK